MLPPAPATGFAPGRANLIGEHTDYNGGLCLPIALPLGTKTVWSPSGEHGPSASLSVHSAGVGSWQGRVGDLKSPLTGWSRYALGALAALEHQYGGHLEITSRVPVGSGLSSSAAVICSVLRAVSALPVAALVPVAIEAETRFAQAPTGGLDQTISLLAESGSAMLLDFSSGARSHVAFAPEADGVHLVVVDSKVHHSNSSGGYAQRRSECERARELLRLEHLATATMDQASQLPQPLRRRAAHVVSETQRVGAVVAAIGLGDWGRVGALFSQSHCSLRDDFEVSCPEVDVAVAAAHSAGALGARMTGGGFGGSLLALTEDPERTATAIKRAFAERGWRAPGIHMAPAAAGAIRVEATSTARY